ncbi:MAG: AAA family ATPase [Nanoarchaeota archaeon]|nr:AAA family ATPase [Nanoarchaeota archaeon]
MADPIDISKYEVPSEKLTWKADVKDFKFNTTAEIEPPKEPIDIVKGQDSAKQTILRAIESKRNVLLLGPAGCGKSLLAKTVAEQYSKKRSENIRLYDQVLVHNFQDHYSPEVLALPTPLGSQFKTDLRIIMKGLPDAIRNGWMINSKQDITKIPVTHTRNSFFYTESYSTTVGNLIKNAEKYGGYKLVKDYKEVLDKEAIILNAPILELDGQAYSLKEIFPALSKGAPRDLRGLFSLESIINKYTDQPKVMKFFEQLVKDTGENLDVFKVSFFDNYTGQNPMMKNATQEKYTANLIVDNSETTGLPVQYIENPTIQNLMGEAGHDALNMTPPHTRCQAGKLHKANGGIIIIDELITILQNQFMRNYLLTVLQEKKGRIGGGHGLSNGGTSAGIETQPVEADCIVIGCANEDLLQILTPKIARRFQYKVTLDATMDNTLENRLGYAEFVKFKIDEYNSDPKNKDKLPHAAPGALAALVERGIRMSQSHSHGKNKLTNILDPIGQLVTTAGLIANEQKKDVIEKVHIDEAVKESRKVNSQMEDDKMAYIDKDFIQIKTEGLEVGSVNGLAVSQDEFGLVSFGYPMKIKASVSEGQSLCIEYIDADSNLGGDFYKKANKIVEAFLKQKFSKRKMSSCSATVSFKQNYSKVDGDSASIAHTVALLSKLSGIPADQGYAMTGSMDEDGNVQPIGGVNEKIEGFYKVCKKKGLTGNNGTIIPESNVHDLMLGDDVVKDGDKFKIYSVRSIDDVVRIVMHSDMETVEKRVHEKLDAYAKNIGGKNA